MKLESAGQSAVQVRITGNIKNNEPPHVRIVFPGGHVEVTRAKDGEDADYWCHVYVDRLGSGHFPPDVDTAQIIDARIDGLWNGTGSSFVDAKTYKQREIYHVAFRVKRDRIVAEEQDETISRKRSARRAGIKQQPGAKKGKK